jgi:hypothetical protein
VPYRAVVCEVCDKVERTPHSRVIPEGWRRVTMTNPISVKRRGTTAVVCSPGCGSRFVEASWDTPIQTIIIVEGAA